MSPSPLEPLPGSLQRDGDGRLVGMAFESIPPLASSSSNRLLVAVDASDNALRAVEYAARQAGLMTGCALHLVHVQPWLAREAAETWLAQLALDETSQARTALAAAGQPWQLHVVMGDPAECILETAADLQVANIIIGSRGLNAMQGLLLGSVAYKVMHLATVPVTVVP